MSELLMLWGSVCVILFFSFMIFRCKRRKLYEFAAKVKTLKFYPILGVAPKFMFRSSTEIFKQLNALSRTSDPLAGFWFGPTMVLKVSDPDVLQIVLHSPDCLDKPYIYKFLKCGKGIFPSTVEVWKKNRKLVNSTFNLRILKSFFPIFNEKDEILADMLKMYLNEDEFDILPMIEKCTIDSICATTMGINLNFQGDSEDGNKFLGGIKTLLNTVTNRVFNIFHHSDFIYNVTKECRTQNKAINDCMSMIQKVIENKRAELQPSDIQGVSDEKEEFKKPQIYINELFRLEKEKDFIDDEAISHHVFALIFGGYETSAFAISTTILLLAQHQDIQEKVFNELKQVFYSADELPDFDLISKLVYLEMVIKETIRLYPSAPYLLRLTTADVSIEDKDLTIPPDVFIGIPIYDIHRDPKHWGSNPDEFNPDNFLPERVKHRNTYTYMPFSAGPRSCLGIKYAMYAMKVMLAMLLRRYKFNTKQSIESFDKKFEILLKLKQKHLVSIESRNF